MSYNDAVRAERDGPVTTVLLSRPERRNAVDGATAVALALIARWLNRNDRHPFLGSFL